MKKKLLSLILGGFAAVSSCIGQESAGVDLEAYSVGPEWYVNGVETPASECYALVWTANDYGSAFKGFKMDGALVEDNPAMCTNIGFCTRNEDAGANLIWWQGSYSCRDFDCTGGTYTVYALDTRYAKGNSYACGRDAKTKKLVALNNYAPVRGLENFSVPKNTGMMPKTFSITGGVDTVIDIPAVTEGFEPDPREGYEFEGWTTNADGVIVADWTPISYPIAYDLGGGKNAAENPETYTVEDNITLAAPTREGYKFTGWTPMSGVISPGTTGAVTFVAHWTRSLIWTDDEPFPTDAKSVTYNGFVVDEENAVLGVVQLKTSKLTAKATVTVDGKKWSYSKGVISEAGGFAFPTNGVVPGFSGVLGANGLVGTWGEEGEVFGAKAGLEASAYQGKWSLTVTNAADAVRLQLTISAKGAVKIAGNWEKSGAKVSASATLVVGEDFAYVPVVIAKTKSADRFAALVKITNAGEVTLLSASEGALAASGKSLSEIKVDTYLPSAVSQGGSNYWGRIVLADECAYPAKFSAKGLPSGLKINAATGVISGVPKKPGTYTVTVTATSGQNSKAKDVRTITIEVANFTDALIPIDDAYGPYFVGVAVSNDFSAFADCKVSGLPAGLKWKNGVLSGVPTKACTNTVYFKKSVKELVNGRQKSVAHQASATFRVEGMRPFAIGTFDGGGTNGVIGLVKLTIGKTGKISGKCALGGTNWTVKASSFAAFDPETTNYTAKLTFTAKKVSFTADLTVEGNEISGVAVCEELGFEAAQNVWKTEGWKDLASELKGQVWGTGEIELKIGSAGAVKAKNTVTLETCSTVLIPLSETEPFYLVYLSFKPYCLMFEVE